MCERHAVRRKGFVCGTQAAVREPLRLLRHRLLRQAQPAPGVVLVTQIVAASAMHVLHGRRQSRLAVLTVSMAFLAKPWNAFLISVSLLAC